MRLLYRNLVSTERREGALREPLRYGTVDLSNVDAEILVLGTGKTIFQPPPSIREHLNKMGIQLEVMDTVRVLRTRLVYSSNGLVFFTSGMLARPITFSQKRVAG